MYALIDSNNFFVSCERLFRPDLTHKPVIVLSSNDGCAISRSAEAKALGVRMGEPIFKLRNRFAVLTEPTVPGTRAQRGQATERSPGGVKTAFEQSDESTSRGVSPSSSRNMALDELIAFSANFELYGDISERIATLLTSITPHIELYSIDEAFLDLDQLGIADYEAWGRAVRAQILQNIGIPISIGIAPTKTLCKLANHWAKTHAETQGVFCLDTRVKESKSQGSHRADHSCATPAPIDSLTPSYLDSLSHTGVADVWGVGWRLAPKLKAEGVFTALDLAGMNPKRAQQLMGIHGRHMVYELNGTRCVPLQPHTKPQHMINRGRQFGNDTSDFQVIEAAVTTLATRAVAELRREHQLAQYAGVTLRTNHRKPGYTTVFAKVYFGTPTADVGHTCSQLIQALEQEYNPRLNYHKADVFLWSLSAEHRIQTDLLGNVDLPAHHRSQDRMRAIDAINSKYGHRLIGPAAEKLSSHWRPRSNMLSPRYTSEWSQLPEARLQRSLH